MTKARENSDYTGLAADIVAGDTAARAGRKNILINGSFRVSQRGDYTSATSATHAIYMLDRWRGSISPASTIQNLGGYIELKATSAATGSVRVHQKIEDLYLLEGQTVTVSCEMKSNTANGRLQMHNGSWVADNASHTGGGDWETLSFTVSMPSSLSVTSIQVGIDGVSSANVPIAVGDYCQIKNVQLELGSVATDFEHRSYGEELALCQRYFEVLTDPKFRGLESATKVAQRMGVTYKTTKRTNPSVTLVGTLRVFNGGGVTTLTASNISSTWATIDTFEFDSNADSTGGSAQGNASIAYTLTPGSPEAWLHVDAEL